MQEEYQLTMKDKRIVWGKAIDIESLIGSILATVHERGELPKTRNILPLYSTYSL